MYPHYINRKKTRTKKFKRNTRIAVTIGVAVALLSWFLIQYFLLAVPSVQLVSEERVRAMAMIAIEDAAMQTFTSDYVHSDLIYISRDSDGNITFIQANTMLIHSLVRITSARAHENLVQIERDGICMPIGAFTGFRIFAGYGPDINLRVLNVGIMRTHLDSEFFAAGINQTLHRITLMLTAEVTIIMPGLQSHVSATIPVPIIESTIVGTVPNVFFQNDLLNRSLNLIP